MAKRKRKQPKADTPDLNPEVVRQSEPFFGALTTALQDTEFQSEAEQQAFIEKFMGEHAAELAQLLGGEDAGLAAAEAARQLMPKSDADRLFWDAMEARTPAVLRRKLTNVLKLEPEHLLTLTALAMMEPSPTLAEEALRKTIAIGERQLGNLKTEAQGCLSEFHESRPYMECRHRLAQLLSWQEGREEDAIAEYQELLRLDENDTRGLRDPLLGLLLETQRFAEARGLLKQYEGDDSACWMYGEALLEFHKQAEAAKWSGPEHDHAWLERQIKAMSRNQPPQIPAAVRKADKTLIKALKHNPWCAVRLIMTDDWGDEPMPGFYQPGSEEEARVFVEHQANAWQGSAPALFWLMVTAMPWLIANGFEEEVRP